MVTKGHDLPRVTLVGVLNADAALSIRIFALRSAPLSCSCKSRAAPAGARNRYRHRPNAPNPITPAITLAAAHDVDAFLEREMRDREELGYPPFSRLALVKLEGMDEAENEPKPSAWQRWPAAAPPAR